MWYNTASECDEMDGMPARPACRCPIAALSQFSDTSLVKCTDEIKVPNVPARWCHIAAMFQLSNASLIKCTEVIGMLDLDRTTPQSNAATETLQLVATQLNVPWTCCHPNVPACDSTADFNVYNQSDPQILHIAESLALDIRRQCCLNNGGAWEAGRAASQVFCRRDKSSAAMTETCGKPFCLKTFRKVIDWMQHRIKCRRDKSRGGEHQTQLLYFNSSH